MDGRLIQNGNTAVILHVGYGGGWSTTYGQKALFDRAVAHWLLEGGSSKEYPPMPEYFREVAGSQSWWEHVLDQLAIEWVPVGTEFKVFEYDGSEYLMFKNQVKWEMA